MQAGIGISSRLSAARAARAAVGDALRALGNGAPDGALVFATGAWGSGLEELTSAVADEIGTQRFAGASVEGLSAAGTGIEHNPGLAVLAWSGLETQPFWLEGLAGEEQRVGEELLAVLREPLAEADLLLICMDSERLLPRPLLEGIAEVLGEGRLVGLGASPLPGGRSLVWGAGEGPDEAAITGLCIRGHGPGRQTLVRGCRPVSDFFDVTRARGNWVLGLDGRRALDLYRETARTLELGDADAAARHLAVLIAHDSELAGPADEPELDGNRHYQVRNIVGLDPAKGAIALPQPVSSGITRIAFGLHDAVAARVNLEEALAREAETASSIGLFIASGGHATSPFGSAESVGRCLERALPGAAILGLHGAFQIASANGHRHEAALLTHCGVLTLLEG